MTRWHKRGQSCINPSIAPSRAGRFDNCPLGLEPLTMRFKAVQAPHADNRVEFRQKGGNSGRSWADSGWKAVPFRRILTAAALAGTAAAIMATSAGPTCA